MKTYLIDVEFCRDKKGILNFKEYNLLNSFLIHFKKSIWHCLYLAAPNGGPKCLASVETHKVTILMGFLYLPSHHVVCPGDLNLSPPRQLPLSTLIKIPALCQYNQLHAKEICNKLHVITLIVHFIRATPTIR